MNNKNSRAYRTLWEQRKRDRNRLLTIKEAKKEFDKKVSHILGSIKVAVKNKTNN
jgi:hypothetical protein